MDELEILRALKGACNADNAALVSRDGLTIAVDVAEGVYAETFSIMCATILGAAITTALELGKSEPEFLAIETPEGKIVVTGAGKRALLVLSVPSTSSMEMLKMEVQKAVDEFRKVY